MQSIWKKSMVPGLLIVTGAIFFGATRLVSDTTLAQVPDPPIAMAPTGVNALGRVEPQGEVIRLAPSPASGTSRVGQLLVREGQRVRKGQAIAYLDTYTTRLMAVKQAQAGVLTSKAHLAQVEAGAKVGQLDAQRATITRLQAELEIAEREYQRFWSLEREGAISASDLDRKLLTRNSTAESLRQAKATLVSLAEVRPTDLRAAQADVFSAEVSLQQAEAALELSIVRSTVLGRVLKIYAWQGESVGSNGLAEIGATDQMYVVAQVYESDIRKIHQGQAVNIASDALPTRLQGAVERVGWLINKQDVLDTDPAADVDTRIVEVHVRVDPQDSPKLAALSNLEVQLSFLP